MRVARGRGKKETVRYGAGEFSALLWIRLPVLLLLATGLILSFYEFSDTTFNLPMVLVTAIGLGTGLWYTWYHFRKIAVGLTAAVLLAGLFTFWRQTPVIRRQFRHIITILQGGSTARTDVTMLMLLVAIGLTLAVFYCEIVLGDPGIAGALVLVFLLGGPLVGLHESTGTVFILGLWLILFLFYRWIGGRKKRRRLGKTLTFLPDLLIVGISFAMIFLVLSPIASSRSSFFYGIVSKIQGTAANGNGRGGSSAQMIIDGRVSRGDNYPAGKDQIRIIVDKKPDEPIYLKSFTGGAYSENGWAAADETALSQRMAKEMDMERRVNIDFVLGDMVFYANGGPTEDSRSRIRRMYIEDASKKSDRADTESRPEGADVFGYNEFSYKYRPYFSSAYYWEESRDEAVRRPDYYYYEEKDMNVDWSAFESGSESSEYAAYFQSMSQLRSLYQQESKSMYTAVPENLLPRLTAFCKANPQTGLDNISAFILSTLQNNATYTLTPGLAPLNQDTVESFLFDRHRGYCVHFASAAVLMYRLYGVPSRYAAGYMANPGDFMQREDGMWEATLTDASAHAWAEIYLDNYGWTPVDMTPSADNTSTVSYPGLDTEKLTAVLNQNRETQTASDNQENDTSEKKSTSEDRNTDSDSHHLDLSHPVRLIRQHPTVFWCILVLLIYSAVMFPFWQDYRRMRRLNRLDVRQVFALMLDMLHHYDYLKDYRGNEPDFADQLAAIPGLSEKMRADGRKMMTIVQRAAFSKERPGMEETLFTREYYIRIAKMIPQRISAPRRFAFRFIHRYG